MKLYHYTNIDSFSKIWVTKRLLFSDNFSTNDIFEQRKFSPLVKKIYSTQRYSSPFEAYKEFDKLYTNELSKYKQISFTTDYLSESNEILMKGWMSPMMWGQYAHNRNGVCIEIESNNLEIKRDMYQDRVTYTYNIPQLKIDDDFLILSSDTIKQYIASNLHDIFYIKHKHWEHENEYRIIKRTKLGSYLSIKNAITAVYVFSANTLETQIVEQLLQNSIDLYALWTENDNGNILIDRVYMPQYRKAMNSVNGLAPIKLNVSSELLELLARH